MTDTVRVTSVIIPAHNEAAVIGRLLNSLVSDAQPGEFDVLVVCNGCTDATADVARHFGHGVRVVELTEPSKHLALIEGDALSTSFPRVYVDADVWLDTASVRALTEALQDPTVLAAAPGRRDMLEQSSWGVRAYYQVWSRLPAVQHGLFGRGVLALSEVGYRRIAERPAVTGDDLYVDSQFSPAERRIVAEATSYVFAPRSMRGLLLRRTRAAQGNAELRNRTGGRTDTTDSSTKALVRMMRGEPVLWPRVVVFAIVTLIARQRATRSSRSRRPSGWLRDDTSRT
jgi:glycosyltransferase involved in cell wall biosynthesis